MEGVSSLIRIVGVRGGILTFLALLAVYILVSIFILITRAARGHEVEFELFKVYRATTKPNRQLEKLKSEFIELQREYNTINSDSKHKSNVLGLIDSVGEHSNKLLHDLFEGTLGITSTLDPSGFEGSFDKACSFALSALYRAVSAGKMDAYRVSILIADENKENLYILKGNGYSRNGLENLKLRIDSSFAGESYRTKKTNYSGNLSESNSPFIRVPNQKVYSSLICVPIKIFDEVLGILNVDCTAPDAFGGTDGAYVEYFANQMSFLLVAREMSLILVPMLTQFAAAFHSMTGSEHEYADDKKDFAEEK